MLPQPTTNTTQAKGTRSDRHAPRVTCCFGHRRDRARALRSLQHHCCYTHPTLFHPSTKQRVRPFSMHPVFIQRPPHTVSTPRSLDGNRGSSAGCLTPVRWPGSWTRLPIHVALAWGVLSMAATVATTAGAIGIAGEELTRGGCGVLLLVQGPLRLAAGAVHVVHQSGFFVAPGGPGAGLGR